MSMEDEKNPAVAGSAAGAPAPASVPSATAAPEPPRRSAEQNLELFSVNPPGASEVAQGAAEIADAGAREAEEAEKARTASQNALRAAGVATVAAFERYAAGDGSPASQRAAIFAARTPGDRPPETDNTEGGVTETIEFDRNGDFHLRFWRKKDGFPLGFDYNQMRDGLQRQGFLDDLDGELKQKLGIEAPKPEVLGKNGKPLSAGEYFGGISGMDAATRRAYSNSIGAANLFFGGDEEAMTHYFETLEAQENPAAPQVDPREAFRKEYFDAKGRGEKAFALDALKRYEGDLDPEFVAAIRGELDADDWGVPAPAAGKGSSGEPEDPAEQDWHKAFQEKYNAAKDPESKKLVVDLFGQVLGEERVVKFKEQIEREIAAGASGRASGAPASSESGGGQPGAEPPAAPANPVAAAAISASGNAPAPSSDGKGEIPAGNSLGDAGANLKAESRPDESKGPVARKGTYGENSKTQDFGFVAPRGTYYDADQLEWDTRKGKYVAKKDERPWFPPAAGNTVMHVREEEPRKNGGKRFVRFVIDPRSVEFWEAAKRGAFTFGIGALTEMFQKDKMGEEAAYTAHEMLRRLGHHSNGTAHGWPSYRMLKEDFDEFMKYVKSGEMPPKPKPAPASDESSGDDSSKK